MSDHHLKGINKFVTKFQHSVLDVIKEIPAGKLATYQTVAYAIGKPGAVRAVGNALNSNPQIGIIPCHRVVKSDGQIGGYRLGVKQKIHLLTEEGIEVIDNKIANFKNYLHHFKHGN